ncbi:somatostatin receptor type 2-like [Glandiceps talaboti]
MANLTTANFTIDTGPNNSSEFLNGWRGLPPWFLHVFIPIINGVICFSGLIGNGIVIYLILRRPSMKTVPNMYILNLASADFLFLLDLIFLTIEYVIKDWIFGAVMCKIVIGIDGMNMFTGIFTLTAMTVDRYLAIVHAIWSKNHRTVLQARVVCILLWLISIAVTIPLWMYATLRSREGITSCNTRGPPWVEKLFALYSFAIGFMLPIIVISICYTRILVYLARNSKMSKPQSSKSKIGRVSLMILMAVLVFVICWLPFWTIRVYLLTEEPTSSSMALQIVYYLSQCLTYANSSLNPLVYAYFKRDFRRTKTDDVCRH